MTIPVAAAAFVRMSVCSVVSIPPGIHALITSGDIIIAVMAAAVRLTMTRFSYCFTVPKKHSNNMPQ
jgi:hypothetical protein